MQLSQALPKLKERWASNWKTRQLSRRLRELSLQFLGYMMMTMLMLATAAEASVILLPDYLQQGSIAILALIYACELGMATARSFDQDHILFRLDLIAADVDRMAQNTGSADIEGLRADIAHLEDRLGPP